MTEQQSTRDMAARPLPFAIVWGIPVAVIISMNVFQAYLPFTVTVLIIAGALAAMGLACVANARRCGRLHCKFSGPIFLIGAGAVLVSGFGIFGAPGTLINEVVWATLGLALSTYVLEWIWGPYGRGHNT